MDYAYCIQQLYQLVGQQQMEINQLHAALRQLYEDVQALKAKPPVTVGRLEYKFDQLKVETLEGTLNIGMNPAQLKDIEDLGISPDDLGSPLTVETRKELTGKLMTYVNDGLNRLDAAGHPPELLSHIRDELEKQIPSRIEHYAHWPDFRNGGKENKSTLTERIYGQMTEDIDGAIHSFINGLHTSKGDV